MSAFNSRRGPNVTQYLRTIDTDLESEAAAPPTDIDDFVLFTNTQFYDFESGQTTDFQPQPVEAAVEPPSTASPTDLTAPAPTTTSVQSISDMSSSILFADFNLDFSTGFPMTPQLAGFPESLGAMPTATPASPSAFPQSTSPYSPTCPSSPIIGEKRKASDSVDGSSNSHSNPDDAARLAAEEDKRRRNTAASARFRHKKKQREQEMERKAKESEEKINKLQSTVQTLLAENKWLKNMILEKSGGNEDVGKKLDELSAKIQEAAAGKEALLAKEKKRAEATSTKVAMSPVKVEIS